MSTPLGPDRRPDRQNGLVAAAYAWLRSVDARECEVLLEAMEQAQIACYTAVLAHGSERTREVYVDDLKTAEAATVADAAHRRYAGRRITIDAQEIDDRFAELVSALDGPPDVPDEPAAPEVVTEPRPAVGPRPGEPTDGWRRADGDWLAEVEEEDEGDFEPPPPEPLPRPTSKVVGGILLLIAGCIALFSPAVLPIPLTASIVLGVALIGSGVGYLLMQLRDYPENPFDDGARV